MIDRTKLETLLGNDEKMIEKFLNIFKTQTPDQLSILIRSVAENKWEQASITAHAIKSQCRYLGLEDIAELALNIEQYTEERKQLGLIPGLATQLETKLMEVLQSYI